MLMQPQRIEGQPSNVFDWIKAVGVIKENGIKNASAGLVEDWFWTASDILENGKIPQGEWKPYLASHWATPALRDDDKEISCDCYILSTETEWDAKTYWPDEAVQLFKSNNNFFRKIFRRICGKA